MTQYPYAHLFNTNEPQNNFPQQTRRTSYLNIVQPSQRRSQNRPLSHKSTDPLYQMNQHTTYNPTTRKHGTTCSSSISLYTNTARSIHKYFRLNTKTYETFGCLDHSYTPEEYLQQVEARLTFAIGEEPQNNPTY